MTEFEPFATVLRRTRREREDPQTFIEELTGARQATVSRWEAGALFPEPDAYKALAKYLGITVTDVRKLIERSELETKRAKLARKMAVLDQQLATFVVK